jgi:hypothetical protein
LAELRRNLVSMCAHDPLLCLLSFRILSVAEGEESAFAVAL